MILAAAAPSQRPALAAWLDDLQDPACAVSLDHAFHDRPPPDWRHAGTTVPSHVNWLALANGAQGEVAGQQIRVEPGDWLCLPPGTPLHFRPLVPGRSFELLRFRLALRRDGVDRPIPYGGFLLRDARGLRELATRLISDAEARDAFAPLRRRGLLVTLYGEAFRHLTEGTGIRTRALSDDEAARIDQAVARSLPTTPAPALLAAQLGMKPDTFARAFKRRYGQSPRAWLAARRIRHAADLLLAREATATAVAEACGYGDVFHFCRQFRAHMGSGTRTWRRRHGLE